MSDGNNIDVNLTERQRYPKLLSCEESDNVLLETIHSVLIYLDHSHSIIDASKTLKTYFGFEHKQIIGLSILILVEHSERDSFLKFLNHPSQFDNICYVRMILNNITEYRQFKVHCRKRFNRDNIEVHSTTMSKYNNPIDNILLVTLENSSYIDLALHDIYQQEFYTKMNLFGEIIFEDHRGALITGYLPNELVSQSIFNFVYHDDCLIKLHALWKCVTTGASKLQWRFNSRNGTVIYLQTEYKLIANNQNHNVIVARNETLHPTQITQFEELQIAWKHQCAADIKGNSSSFKSLSTYDPDLSSIPNTACCIRVPTLNICFTTNKLQAITINGNIFEAYRSARPLTTQDYINLLIVHDSNMDNDLARMISHIQSLAKRPKNSNESDIIKMDVSDAVTDVKNPLEMPTDTSLQRKSDSNSIIRSMFNNSIKQHQEKLDDDLTTTINKIPNGSDINHMQTNGTRPSTMSTAQNSINPPNLQQNLPGQDNLTQKNIDFMRKYKIAKLTLESQLESLQTQGADVTRKNAILQRLSALEYAKIKVLENQKDSKIQTATFPVHNYEQNNVNNSSFASNSNNLSFANNTNRTSSSFHSPNPQQFDYTQTTNYFETQSQLFDEFLTPPPSSSSSSTSASYIALNNNPSTPLNSYIKPSYYETTNNSTSIASLNNHHSQTMTYPYQ